MILKCFKAHKGRRIWGGRGENRDSQFCIVHLTALMKALNSFTMF